jgi:tetratricopeptide (TPR) repeat protein
MIYELTVCFGQTLPSRLMKNIAKILSASLLGLSLFVFFSPNTWADANSDHINKLFDKANSDTDAGNYQSAKDTANQIISIDPNAWQGYFARVGSELGSKNYQNALDDYNKTVSLAPELSSVPSFLVFKSVAE